MSKAYSPQDKFFHLAKGIRFFSNLAGQAYPIYVCKGVAQPRDGGEIISGAGSAFARPVIDDVDAGDAGPKDGVRRPQFDIIRGGTVPDPLALARRSEGLFHQVG